MIIEEASLNLSDQRVVGQMTDRETSITNIVVLGMLLFFSIVGSVGNLLVLVVFAGKRSKIPTKFFISTLAITDIFTCSIVIPCTMAMEYLEFHIHSDVLCKLYMFLITSNVPFSAFVIAAIAFDRYLRICFPLRRYLTIARSKLTVGVQLLITCCFGLLTAMNYGTSRIETKTIMSNEYITEDIFESLLSNSTDTYYHLLRLAENRNVSIEEILSPFHESQSVIVHTGLCEPNHLILGETFTMVFQKIYSFFFLIIFLFIATIYILIFKYVINRRTIILRMKSRKGKRPNIDTESGRRRAVTRAQLSNGCVRVEVVPDSSDQSSVNNLPDTPSPNLRRNGSNKTSFIVSDGNSGFINPDTEQDIATARAKFEESAISSTKPVMQQGSNLRKTVHLIRMYRGTAEQGRDSSVRNNARVSGQKQDEARRVLSNKNFIANIRTAISLFIVTFVFILAFLPAWLMALRLIHYNRIIFYMYFIYNVVNPVIYSFLNYEFRNSVRHLYNKSRCWFRRDRKTNRSSDKC